MLLSLSVSGLPCVGADIGGFNNPDSELMAQVRVQAIDILRF